MENNGENPKALGMVDPVEPVKPVEPEEIIEPPAGAHCPSCNGPGIRKGKTILCEICDCSFRYTKEGPKVDEIGPFDKLANRVSNIEGIIGTQPPEPKVVLPPISVREDMAEAAEEAERRAAEAAEEAEREAAERVRAESADNGI